MAELYDYQAKAVDAVFDAFERGVTRPAIVFPTGGGKTRTFSRVAARFLARHPRKRVVVVAHRRELIDQGAAALRQWEPQLRVGVCMGRDRNNVEASVVVGTVQTLQYRKHLVKDVGLVIVDECHHATARSYREILAFYGCMDSAHPTPALGVTATMMRGDDTSLGDIWQDVVAEKALADLINDGFLVRPEGIRVYVPDLDLGSVRRSRGDYSEGDLGRAIEGSLAPELIAKAYREHAGGRQGVSFAPTVHSARVVADALVAEGITTDVIWGEMPPRDRAAALDRFRLGEVQVLSNCGVLTEGTDLPMISAVVIARPTQSQGLYLQMTGRGLRLWCPVHKSKRCAADGMRCPGAKSDCLVLDVVGATQRHSLQCSISLFGETIVVQQEREELTEDQMVLAEMLAGPEKPAAAGVAEPEEWVYGIPETVVVDLFHGAAARWERTKAGVRFVEAGERFIALLPNLRGGPGHDVVSLDKYERGTATFIAAGVADLGTAMRYAEAAITVRETTTAARKRSWRYKPISDGQRTLAHRWGVEITDDMKAGRLSTLINIEMASARIDWHPAIQSRGK